MQELKPSDGPPRPALALEMTKRNKMAFIHYKQCRAVMWNTKDARDLFVQKNAAIIRECEEEAAARRSVSMANLFSFGGNR